MDRIRSIEHQITAWNVEFMERLPFISSLQLRSEFDKRYALEQRLRTNDQPHQRSLTDAQQRLHALWIAWLLLICGCQSTALCQW